MKTITLITTVTLFLNSFGISGEEPISKSDRKFASDYLKSTMKELKVTVDGLSTEQLNYKIDEDSWSIAQCLEHIAISENFIFESAQNAINESAEAGPLAFDNEMLIKVMTDRSQKVKTFDVLKPINSFGTPEQSLKTFETRRNEHIKYVKKTEDDLHGSYFDFPFGKGDAYQVLLFMSAHCERHTKQIKEIMKSEGFPNE